MCLCHTHHHRSEVTAAAAKDTEAGKKVSLAWRLHLQFVGSQQLLASGRSSGNRDRWAAGDDDGRAGQNVSGHQAHAVGHGCQVWRVAQASAGTQALADGEGLLWVENKENNFERERKGNYFLFHLERSNNH